MSKKKIKAGELTLNQIVEIAEKHKGSCSKCPLYDVPFIPCFKFCEEYNAPFIIGCTKEELKKEIEVEEDD